MDWMDGRSYFHVSYLPDNVCRAPATLSHLEIARTFHLKKSKKWSPWEPCPDFHVGSCWAWPFGASPEPFCPVWVKPLWASPVSPDGVSPATCCESFRSCASRAWSVVTWKRFDLTRAVKDGSWWPPFFNHHLQPGNWEKWHGKAGVM